MAGMSELFGRAETLRGHGLTELRIFWRLRNEFPVAERDMLLKAARLEGSPTGITPGWALWGQPLRPTQIRFKQKSDGRPDERIAVRTRKVLAVDYPLLTVEANDLREGDWIENIGRVETAYPAKKHIVVNLGDGRVEIYLSDAPVRIHLEDKGDLE